MMLVEAGVKRLSGPSIQRNDALSGNVSLSLTLLFVQMDGRSFGFTLLSFADSDLLFAYFAKKLIASQSHSLSAASIFARQRSG